VGRGPTRLAGVLASLAVSAACSAPATDTVVIYTSVDQQYSEPVLQAFSQQTGIQVLPVYDVEAAKTTGLVNRLIAEKSHPRADVFWNGEFMQTLLLKQEGLLAAYDSPGAEGIPEQYRDPERYWTGTAGRARVFLVNTRLVAADKYPAALDELLDPAWPAGDVAAALPLFGTSLTHAAALYAKRGPAAGGAFFRTLKQRGVQLADGNSVVRDLVVSGRAHWGLTDTDDAAGALSRGAAVAVVFPDQGPEGAGTLVVPGTVALLAGAPHEGPARRLVDFLLSPETEALLIQSGWCHVPLRPQTVRPEHFANLQVKALEVRPEEVFSQLAQTKSELQKIFLR